MEESVEAKLVLEDGTVFKGHSFSVEKSVSGEVVFSTGMVGYPQSLTDPSYHGQILTLTYPLIGNYGVPPHSREGRLEKHFESYRIHVKALVVSEHSTQPSHWNARTTLQEWLVKERVPAIEGIDTRALTRKLRKQGTMLGKLVIGKDVELVDPNERNLAAEVSSRKVTEYGKGRKRIALIDCGVKNNIIRSLAKRGVKVLRVPWDYDPLEKERVDALVVSNGPGDPTKPQAAVETVKKAMEYGIPVFGICFGNQLLALAAGAKTYKLKYGHRSQNQPCVLKGTDRGFITSQNHGYAIDAKTLPRGWKEWFVNANDGTNEGIRHAKKPFMAVQFHPEASPGPTDTDFLFDKFLEAVP